MQPNMMFGGPVPPLSQLTDNTGAMNIPTMPINNLISKVNNSDTTLYVGNLHPSMDETRIFEIFRGYGPISTCKLMKDLYTQESRGFAFVTFNNFEDAKKAKDELNYKKFEDWEMRICFKKSPSDFKDESNIFIKNLSKEVTTKKLDELCSQYGEVLSCVIRNDEKGQSLGYGYVQFESQEQANKAIENLQDIELEGQKIDVSKFVPSKNRTVPKRNIYMKNFPEKWEKKDVENFIKTEIETQGETNCSGVYSTQKDDEPIKFYAFVAFDEEEPAKLCIEKFQDKKLTEDQQDTFYIGYAQSKSQRKALLKKEFQNAQNQTNIFVKSLKYDITEEQLKEAFSEYGTITSICIKPMQTKVPYTEDPLKFGFINYKTPEMAKKAIINYKQNTIISNLIHGNHNTNLPYVCFAQSKRVRLAYLKMKKRMQNFDHFSLIGNPLQQQQQNTLSMNGILGAPMPFIQGGIPAFPPMNKPMNQNGNLDFNLHTSKDTSNPTSVPNEQIKDIYNLEWLKLNQQKFLQFDEDKQRNILGELMYEKVQQSGLIEQQFVSKITGMLIDLEILELEEILEILENQNSLNERIQEAQEVILESDF